MHSGDYLQQFANERIYRLKQAPYEVRLLDEKKLVAMEILLQLDVDLFYWKTFSNHHRQLTYINIHGYGTVSNLFSKHDPQIRFSIVPSGYPNYHMFASNK